MQFKFYNLMPLCKSMRANNKSLEEFDFIFKDITFNCILDIDANPFEMMIGANGNNFACILYIRTGFITEMADADYTNLCRLLRLNWNKNHFSSFCFLNFLDKQIPSVSSPNPVPIEKVIPFRASKLTEGERAEGFVFAGWLTHKGKSNGHVRNINKTRQLLGDAVAEYCERNDISSKWTTDEARRQRLTFPWDT